MKLKGFLIGFAAALSLIVLPAMAQTSSTRATLQTQNNQTIASNGVGAITGSVMNAMLGNVIASEATLLDFNNFSNPPVFGSSGLLFSSAGNPLLFLACTGYVQANGTSAPTCLNGISLPLAPGGTAISPSTNGGILYDNAGVLGDSATLPSGLTVPNPTFTGAVTATGLITAADLAAQPANSVLVNATGSSASPLAQTISGCSAASDALIWTTNVGYGCNTAIAASSMPIGGLTGIGTGVAASLGAATNASGGIVSPTPAAAGDIIYWTGAVWAKFAGNSSGTQVFEENASGAPAWASPTSGGTVTSITCGAGLTGGAITTTGTCASVFGPGEIENCIIAASVSGNALTVSLETQSGGVPSSTSPCVIAFRNATLTTGDYTAVQVTAATTFSTGASGSTFGSSNGIPFRLWVEAWNNAGTVAIGVSDQSNANTVLPLNEGITQASTACSACTNATTLGGFYTTASLSGKAIRILGYVEWGSGLTTAGVYASGPTFIQLMGPGVKKPGDVMQVVSNSTTTSGTTSSATFAALATSQSLAITPTSSVNLIVVDARGTAFDASPSNLGLQVARGSTLIGNPELINIGSAGVNIPSAILVIDQPGVTSSTTYQFQGKTSAGTMEYPAPSSGAILELQEIMGSLKSANDNEVRKAA